MKLVHLDLETTGLNPCVNQIIEIGMIVDDLESPQPLELLPKFHAYVRHDLYQVDAFCTKLHAGLWGTIFDKGIPLKEALAASGKWLHEVFPPGEGSKPTTVFFCGKNVAGFDFQFLKHVGAFDVWESHRIRVAHRVADIGSMFLERDDAKIPDLNECAKRAGIGLETTHTALDDCMMTVLCARTAVLGGKFDA